MTVYKAILADGTSICTVIAKDVASAVAQVETQLRKPGRDQYLKRWVTDGKQVQAK